MCNLSFSVLATFFCCFIFPTAVSSSHEINQFLKHDDFPQVYTAIIPMDSIGFAGEVDLLGVVDVLEAQNSVKISFLVHDRLELAFLKGVAGINSFLRKGSTASDIEVDPALSKDLHEELDYEEPYQVRTANQKFSTIEGYSCYKDVAGTFNWMQAMVDRALTIPNLSVTVKDIGDSHLKTKRKGNGYDIFAMTITGNGGPANGTKSIFFAMTGIHAREYTPPELVSRWAEEDLIEQYGRDADITAMLDRTEIHLVLQSNPDGRAIAETQKWQLRRKSANTEGRFLPCFLSTRGVDLNRNFPFQWDVSGGSSTNQCSQTYRGSKPGSEPEVQAIINYAKEIFPSDQRKVDPVAQKEEPYSENATGVFFDIHSFGELILWPWSHQNKKSANDADLVALANKYKNFNGYTLAGPQQSGWLYEASGTTIDWAYGVLGAAAMTFEIGTSFYQRCEYFEDSILAANKKALTYAAKVSRAPYLMPKGPDIISASMEFPTSGSLVLNVTAGKMPAKKEEVAEIRAVVNKHPFDSDTDTDQVILDGGSGRIDISNLPDGKHVLYLFATGADNYHGPVTAYSFLIDSDEKKEEAVGVNTNTSSGCHDSNEEIRVQDSNIKIDCKSLSQNLEDLGFLCEHVDVVRLCPQTCDFCNE